jgi:hypothetical protein
MDSARHVIGCHSFQETRARNPLDDVTSTIHQSLLAGVGLAGAEDMESTASSNDPVIGVGRCRLTPV